MKICQAHWNMIRESVKSHGMDQLGPKSGEAAAENLTAELQGEPTQFDPNMSHHWHWSQLSLKYGGLYMMDMDLAANPNNEGHRCPICEIAAHYADWDPQAEVNKVSQQMQAWCMESGLIPKVQ